VIKKTITIIIISLTTFSIVSAKPSFGIKCGVLQTTQEYVQSREIFDPDGYRVFEFGVFTDFKFRNNVYLSIGVNSTRRGMSLRVQLINNNALSNDYIKLKSHVKYLSFPVAFKMYSPIGSIKPYLLAGLRLDYKTGYYSEGFEEIYNEFRKTVYGFTLGIGNEFIILNRINLTTEIIYNQDITKALEIGPLHVNNKSLGFLLGLKI